MQNILSLEGRVALVTGAGQGVGRQVALHFAAHGASAVIVNDFYVERAESVAREVAELGVRGIPMAGDVTDFETMSTVIRTATDEAGGLHILVNNAGNAGPEPGSFDTAFWETDPKDWNRWLGTNLFGVLNVCRAAIPVMLKSSSDGGGSIVNVISDAGRVGEANLAVYSAAKAGASGLSRALAKSLGSRLIRVNAVSLATIVTPTMQPMLEDEALVKKMLRNYIIRRLGQPDDAANMILFLASDASSWVSGQTIAVNGGYSVSQ